MLERSWYYQYIIQDIEFHQHLLHNTETNLAYNMSQQVQYELGQILILYPGLIPIKNYETLERTKVNDEPIY